MQRILMLTDDLIQAGSFWRSGGPLSELLRNNPSEFSLTWHPPEKVAAGAISWTELRMHHWVFMHRPCLPHHTGIVQRAQDLGVKVWVDYDDHLFAVPLDNETHSTYASPNVLGAIDFILKSADVVSTSTLHLHRVLTKVRKTNDILYCPNAVPISNWWGRWKESFDKQHKDAKKEHVQILWRGSRHHQRDLMHMRNAIVNISNKYKNLKFHFVGFLPWHMLSNVDGIFESKLDDTNGISHRPPNEVTLYFKNVLATRPDIVIVPLVDNDFNRAKSNIAWVEGAWAGGHVIAPDWDEWKRPGVSNYKPNDAGSFEFVFDQVMDQLAQSKLSNGWEYICENYNLNVVNEIRKLRFQGFRSHAEVKSQELMTKHYTLK
jgi:hypothetical protein